MKRQYLLEPVAERQITKEFLHALETGLLLALKEKKQLNTAQCTAALENRKTQRGVPSETERNS